MEMWPSTKNSIVDPPVITKMPGRQKKYRKKAVDEPKKKVGKTSRKGTQMTCSNYKRVGHNKKAYPILRGQTSGTAGTSNSGTTQPSQAAETTTQQSGPTSDSATARARNTQLAVVARYWKYRSRTTEDIIASVRGRPRGSGLRGRPRATAFGILFNDSGTVIERCGARDRVHSAPTKVVDAGQNNINLGYSAPGLRWRGRNAITQRKVQQQLRRRQTEASPSQPQVHPSSQPSQTPSHQNLNQSQP